MNVDLNFDTETTDKYDFNQLHTWDGQPDLVQLACKLTIGDEILGSINYIVIPEKPISEGAAKTHGITPEKISRFGVPRRVALIAFNHLVRKASRLTAHNIEFDRGVLRTAYLRENLNEMEFIQRPQLCTMKAATDICKIPGRRPGSFKWPSLQEAYRILVDKEGFVGAHDAMVDVDALFRIKRSLEKKGHVPV